MVLPSMAKYDIAQELVDMIIDNVKDDRWTLRNCSLVCWSWVPTCQRHVFHRVMLLPPCRRYGRRPTDVPYSKRLDDVLLHSPHIVDYIQVLYIYEGQDMREQDWIGEDETLPLLLLKLTKLERLEFRRLHWEGLGSDLKESLCAVLEFPTMTYLEIGNAFFENLEDLEAWLYHAKFLTGLSISSSYILKSCREDQEAGAEEEGLNSVQQSHLVDLHLHLSDDQPFLDWLQGPRSPFALSRIQSLDIKVAYDATSINLLLRTIGNSLKQCKLENLHSMRFGDVVINLEFNTGLRSLHLKSINVRSEDNNSLPLLLHILSTIGKHDNDLEVIKLDVDIFGRDGGVVDWSNWKGVDSILAGPSFKSLRKIEFELRRQLNNREWFQETCKGLVEVFSLLRARGVSVDPDA